VPHVAWLSLAPVKGLALVDKEEIELGPHGAEENRRFFLVDERGRRYGVLEDGRLVQVRPEWDPERWWLALRFPDGGVAQGVVELGEPLVSDLYDKALPAHEVCGPWSGALSDFLGKEVRLAHAEKPTGAVDRPRGPVSLVSEASLEELGRQAGLERPVDGRRFRMLVGVDGCEPHEEDEWCGREVAIGEAVVRILEPVARCVITTRDPDTGERDLDTLREIKKYRGTPRGHKYVDFGVFGDVLEPGRVRVGDRVAPH
jgi:uncharacterized protein YcbX